MVRRKVRALLDRQQYHPGTLGIAVNPFYFARKGLLEAMKRVAPQIRGRVLDVGCGRKPYRELLHDVDYLGLEIDTERSRRDGFADVFYDGVSFPFDDASFDWVIANQVLEHVFTPNKFLGEIARILKPNGRLILTAPFVWDEHEQPWDYARYSSFGLVSLITTAGFEVIEKYKMSNDLEVIFQLINAYIYKVNPFHGGRQRLLFEIMTSTLFNSLGVALCKVFPANDDLYLDNVVLARKSGAAVALT